MKRICVQAVGVWFVFVILAMVNGVARGLWYEPIVGNELLAHQISSVTGISLFLAAMYVFFKKTSAAYTEKDLLLIGALWLVFTSAFEFGFQHYLMGLSWSTLLQDYNILAGRLWGLVLLTIFVGPFLIGRYRLRKGRLPVVTN
jgi:hypothetical protein